MATIALIHGAGSNAAYWSRVVPALERAGHRCVAPDLPCGSDDADFTTYADAVLDALAGDPADVVVGQSLGAYTAPVVAQRCASRLIVLVAPMIPAPGETPGEWGAAVGSRQAQAEYAAAAGFDPAFDLMTTFFHDVPPETVQEVMAEGEPAQSGAIMDRPFPLTAWPAITTRVIAGRDDRLFPLVLTRRLARERLGVEVDEIATGHLPAFARPDQLAHMLLNQIGRVVDAP